MPTIPAHAPKMKYRVPMSLWLVENSQRCWLTFIKVYEIKAHNDNFEGY